MPGKAVRRSDNRRLRAQGLYVLGRERGAQAPLPFPAPYPPLTGAYRKEKVSGRNATLLSRTCPGSSRIGNKTLAAGSPRIGIKVHFQAHLRIGKCCTSKKTGTSASRPVADQHLRQDWLANKDPRRPVAVLRRGDRRYSRGRRGAEYLGDPAARHADTAE